jgi:hypothetical protein
MTDGVRHDARRHARARRRTPDQRHAHERLDVVRIYELCLEALGNPPQASIVAIGDSVEHDIAGAAGVALDTALVMGGIHGAGFDLVGGPEANRQALDQLEVTFGVRPRWLLPRFAWEP